jgi:hypothetical protein
MTKYKQLAEEAEKQLELRSQEISFLKAQLAAMEGNFVENMGKSLESEEAREILRRFAGKASDRAELVLLVRALSKLPA